MPDISVLIPTTTGGFSHLARLMPELSRECAQNDAEIIIIDNASRDGTTNFLSNYECTVIINKNNKGFAVGHNQAATIAKGKYLLLLNNDTVITPGFIKEMKQAFEADPNVGIVGCLIYKMSELLNESKIQHIGVCFTDNYVPYELGLPIADVAPGISTSDPRIQSVREVPSVTAACMMVKREVWDAVGGFDEEYKNGWEDNDFVLKAREKGYKVWYTGKAKVYHKHFGSVGRMTYESQNRERYDSIWVNTGRAKQVLGDFRQA